MPSDEHSHVILIGAMGVGKTTVGRALGIELGRPFLDSDDQIERIEGRSGAEIARTEGVESLHAIEIAVFETMTAGSTPSVIAPAASVVDSVTGRALLSRHLTIFLDAPEDVLAKRRRSGDGHRRDLDDGEVMELDRRRRPWMETIASLRVDTADEPIDELVRSIAIDVRRLELGAGAK